MKKYVEYIEIVEKIIEREKNEGAGSIEKAAELFAGAIKNGSNIFLFGTGHSHMLAEELFYRAGGLVKIQPILETSLMLHESASKSTETERLEGYAEILFNRYKMKKDDVIVIISNSGRNGVIVDMADLCSKNGLKIIALTNMEHTLTGASRHKSGKKLYEFADVVLDNMGVYGDACISLDGLEGKISPTSTVIGAFLLNCVVTEAVELCLEDGFVPDHFSSSNIDGGDEINKKLLEKYSGEVIHL